MQPAHSAVQPPSAHTCAMFGPPFNNCVDLYLLRSSGPALAIVHAAFEPAAVWAVSQGPLAKTSLSLPPLDSNAAAEGPF